MESQICFRNRSLFNELQFVRKRVCKICGKIVFRNWSKISVEVFFKRANTIQLSDYDR